MMITPYSQSHRYIFATKMNYRKQPKATDSDWYWSPCHVVVTNSGMLLVLEEAQFFQLFEHPLLSFDDSSLTTIFRYRLGYHTIKPQPEQYNQLLAVELHIGPKRKISFCCANVWDLSGFRAALSSQLIGDSVDEKAAIKLQRAVRSWIARKKNCEPGKPDNGTPSSLPPDFASSACPPASDDFPPLYEEVDEDGSRVVGVDISVDSPAGIYVKNFHCYSANKDSVFEPNEELFVERVVLHNPTDADFPADRASLLFPSSEIIHSNMEKFSIPEIKAGQSVELQQKFSGRVIAIPPIDVPGQYCLLGSFNPNIVYTEDESLVDNTKNRQFDITVQFPIQHERIVSPPCAHPGSTIDIDISLRNISTLGYGAPGSAAEGPLVVVFDFPHHIQPLGTTTHAVESSISTDHEANILTAPITLVEGLSTFSFGIRCKIDEDSPLYDPDTEFTSTIFLRGHVIEFWKQNIRIVTPYNEQDDTDNSNPRKALLVTTPSFNSQAFSLWTSCLDILGFDYDFWDIEEHNGFSYDLTKTKVNEGGTGTFFRHNPTRWLEKHQNSLIVFTSCDEPLLDTIHPLDLLLPFKKPRSAPERELFNRFPPLPLDEIDSSTIINCEGGNQGAFLFFQTGTSLSMHTSDYIKEKLHSILSRDMKTGKPRLPLPPNARLLHSSADLALQAYVDQLLSVSLENEELNSRFIQTRPVPVCSTPAQCLISLISSCNIKLKLNLLYCDSVHKVRIALPNQRIYEFSTIIALRIYEDLKQDTSLEGFETLSFIEGLKESTEDNYLLQKRKKQKAVDSLLETLNSLLPNQKENEIDEEKIAILFSDIAALKWAVFIRSIRKNSLLAQKRELVEDLCFKYFSKQNPSIVKELKKKGEARATNPLRLRFTHLVKTPICLLQRV